MARPERKTVDYFPHYISDGKKMFYIEQKYGNDGYATWFKILESLASTDDHFLNLNNKMDLLFLSAKCRVDESVILSILNDLSILGEIDHFLWSNNIVYSHKFIESIQDAYTRRTNKCMDYDSFCIHYSGLCTTITRLKYENQYNNTQSKVNETKVNEIKLNEKREKENLFEFFWNLYDKKQGRDVALKSWMKIDLSEMENVIKNVPKYVDSTPDKTYRKNAATYLNGKHWHDEIIFKNNNGNGITNKQTMDDRLAAAVKRLNSASGEQMQSFGGGAESFSDFEVI